MHAAHMPLASPIMSGMPAPQVASFIMAGPSSCHASSSDSEDDEEVREVARLWRRAYL